MDFNRTFEKVEENRFVFGPALPPYPRTGGAAEVEKCGINSAGLTRPDREVEPGFVLRCGNDPSAGSPTETLLRLHLPLNDEV